MVNRERSLRDTLEEQKYARVAVITSNTSLDLTGYILDDRKIRTKQSDRNGGSSVVTIADADGQRALGLSATHSRLTYRGEANRPLILENCKFHHSKVDFANVVLIGNYMWVIGSNKCDESVSLSDATIWPHHASDASTPFTIELLDCADVSIIFSEDPQYLKVVIHELSTTTLRISGVDGIELRTNVEIVTVSDDGNQNHEIHRFNNSMNLEVLNGNIQYQIGGAH